VLLAAALAGVLLRRHDVSADIDPGTLELLRGVPFLGWMPPVGLERLASKLSPLELDAGHVLLREGEPGDRAYLIERGDVVVTFAGREVGRLGPGDLVGEIALLRSVPRTATVVATSDLRVLALDRSEFLVAATGVPDARVAADALIDERLSQLR
jgi:CRP-like cAMP-binding protein